VRFGLEDPRTVICAPVALNPPFACASTMPTLVNPVSSLTQSLVTQAMFRPDDRGNGTPTISKQCISHYFVRECCISLLPPSARSELFKTPCTFQELTVQKFHWRTPPREKMRLPVETLPHLERGHEQWFSCFHNRGLRESVNIRKMTTNWVWGLPIYEQ
jgi:hypothetical protein